MPQSHESHRSLRLRWCVWRRNMMFMVVFVVATKAAYSSSAFHPSTIRLQCYQPNRLHARKIVCDGQSHTQSMASWGKPVVLANNCNRRYFLLSTVSTATSKSVLPVVLAVSLLTPTLPSQAADENLNKNKSNNMSTLGPKSLKAGGLVSKIRYVGQIMDELQRDLMQERWDLVEAYPAQLRSYVPVFTTYTDAAFPTEAPTDKGLRVALRYEVGRLFASVERFKAAATRRALDEAYLAFAEMSVHFDRYLRVGGLYTYYDDTISTEPYFKGIGDDSLIFADPKDPAEVRDLIVLIKGSDKGKTGIVIGKYRDGSNKTIVKLDRYKGIREIRIVDSSWVAKRLGEQAPDDVFLIPRKGS